jgi:protein-L-isoaspartate(D-aspartate) O-methyltransferase
LASATAKSLPLAWQKQLKIGGRIVAPIENSIWLFIKRKENVFEEKEFPGFVFVPLIED